MRRVSHLAVLTLTAAILSGCAVTTPHASPPESSPLPSMPAVVVAGPDVDFAPLSVEELAAMSDLSVSGAVKALMMHGYSAVVVVDEEGTGLRQSEWDLRGVVDVTLDGRDARVTAG